MSNIDHAVTTPAHPLRKHRYRVGETAKGDPLSATAARSQAEKDFTHLEFCCQHSIPLNLLIHSVDDVRGDIAEWIRASKVSAARLPAARRQQ